MKNNTVSIYKIYLIFFLHVLSTFRFNYKFVSFQVSYIPVCAIAGVQVSSSVLPGSSAKVFEDLTDQEAHSILEGDFIELDDLVQ